MLLCTLILFFNGSIIISVVTINMMEKYHMNNIMTGNLDMLCLVCNTYLKSADDADAHITLPIHKKNFSKTIYVEKYEEDHVKKVLNGYYCELCNLLFPMLSKVPLHVEDEKHIANKNYNVLKRVGNHIIAYNELIIDIKSWHGLKDNTCSVCITEFDNEGIHRTKTSHVINLIQKKIVFGPHKVIYRLVDENTYQCLTCNIILTTNSVESHFNEAIHREGIKKCSELYSVFLNNNETIENFKEFNKKNETELHIINEIVNANIPPVKLKKKIHKDPIIKPVSNQAANMPETKEFENSDFNYIDKRNDIDSFNEINLNTNKDDMVFKEINLDKILQFVQTFEKNEVNINFETETAFCKKCFINVNFEFESINDHIKGKRHTDTKRFVSDYVPFQCDARINKPYKNKEKGNLSAVADESTKNYVSAPVVPYYNKNNYYKIENEKQDNNNEEEQAQQRSCDDITDIDEDFNKVNTDLITYAKENHLTYNKNNRNVYCRICLTRIPSSLNSMKEHVKGAKHKAVLIKHEMASIKTLQSNKFFEDVTMTEKFAIINYKFFLPKLSFFMLTPIDTYKLRCHICEVHLFEGQIPAHVKSHLHASLLKDIPVVTSLNNEFVRVVSSGLYHCGYCNHCIKGWKKLQRHLKTESHIEEVSQLSAIFQFYLPKLRQYRIQKAMENNIFRMFFFNNLKKPHIISP
ncbi:uncharacterized protein LOC113514539 [Galleria mellonella]|uniref:Uncharacterized protein LOC113514539 n=1 Tax=Galleria mellonella TaxID=7137 RepID=A0A6J3BZ96_GALME|nr:uncharacterized protein LOC113514539 [Galleria mellonella]